MEILPAGIDLYRLLKGYFGDAAPMLATQLYALNSLTQNPITGAVYKDMRYYPNYIINEGSERYYEKNETVPPLGYKFARTLSLASELRSYGIYGHVERKFGRFSKLKGGVQRALLAMEYLPTRILQRSSIDHWFGFINVWEEPKCWQLQEVIFVPSEDLWKPEKSWMLFHETAHILIERNPTLVSDNVGVIKTFLVDKIDQKYILRLFNEVAAEIIGYELGFFGDFDLLLNCLWPYLIRIESTIREFAAIETYLIRTFFVEIWEECYGTLGEQGDMAVKITIQDFDNEKFLYQKFLTHIQKVENIIQKFLPRASFPDKDSIVSRKLLDIREFLPFLKHLHEEIQRLEVKTGKILRHQDKWKSDPNSKNIADGLLAGEIYWDSIDYPEVVIYHLVKNQVMLTRKTDRVRSTLATIISFWNAQLQHMETYPHDVSLTRA